MKSKLFLFSCLLLESRLSFREERRDQGKAALAEAMALGREGRFFNTFWWRSSVMAGHCVRALEEGIETEYVRDLVRRRNLVPDVPPVHVDQWPWPLKATTLGTFGIEKEDIPLTFGGKAQQKPLALLKSLIALGGQFVAERDLAEILWPDADGDVAHASFDTTLHRLRKLLGSDKAVVLNGGRVSLDQRSFWVDMVAFERVLKDGDRTLRGDAAASDGGEIETLEARIFRLYQGDFLAGEQENAAIITCRERLRQGYLKAVSGLGCFHRERQAWDRAIECFEKGIKIDPLSEEFYQGLMVCYQGMGLENSAVQTYERCCAALKKGLGLGPSTRTRALYAAVSGRTG